MILSKLVFLQKILMRNYPKSVVLVTKCGMNIDYESLELQPCVHGSKGIFPMSLIDGNIESSQARNRLYDPRHADGRFLSFLIIFIVLVIYLLFCVLLPCVLTITERQRAHPNQVERGCKCPLLHKGSSSWKKRNRYFNDLE